MVGWLRRTVLGIVGTLGMVGALSAQTRFGFDDGPDLHAFAARGDVARLARAISAGAPVDLRDAQGRTPLHVAAAAGHLFVVMLVLSKGADIEARDERQRTPLHLAADGDPEREAERFQVVKLLLSEGADPKARDADGKRPADYATMSEFKDTLTPTRDFVSGRGKKRE